MLKKVLKKKEIVILNVMKILKIKFFIILRKFGFLVIIYFMMKINLIKACFIAFFICLFFNVLLKFIG